MAILLSAGNSYAGEISFGGSAAGSGDTNIVLPVVLTSGAGENIVGLNFEITHSANLTLDQVTSGREADESAKSVSSNSPSAGTLRVVIYGIDNNVISDGTIANISFNVSTAGGSDERVTLEFVEVVAADGDAQQVTMSRTGYSGTIADLGVSNSSDYSESDSGSSSSGGCFLNAIVGK